MSYAETRIARLESLLQLSLDMWEPISLRGRDAAEAAEDSHQYWLRALKAAEDSDFPEARKQLVRAQSLAAEWADDIHEANAITALSFVDSGNNDE